jgi:hypothetical protein
MNSQTGKVCQVKLMPGKVLLANTAFPWLFLEKSSCLSANKNLKH